MPYRRRDIVYTGLVGLIALAGLAIRVRLAWTAMMVSRDAADDYLPLAQGWKEGVAGKAFAGGIPPLYPMLTGYLARLVGDVEPAGRIISLVGAVLVLVFVFLLAYRLAGRWTACVAIALVAFHPYLCEFGADVGPDSLAAGFLVATVYGVCAYLLTFSFWNMALTAGALAGLALTRPEGFAYAPLALAVLLAWPVRGTADKERGRGGEGETGRHGDAETRGQGDREQRQGTGDRGQGTADKETRRQGDKEQQQGIGDRGQGTAEDGRQGTADKEQRQDRMGWLAAGALSGWRRRVVHVCLMLLMLGALCVPRLISVHRQTGMWALDTRQQTWSARLWHAIRSGQPEYGQLRIWNRGGLGAIGGTVEATIAGFGPAALMFGAYGLIGGKRLPRRRVALVIVLFAAFSFVLILVGNRITKRYLLGAGALWQVWAAIGIALVFLRAKMVLRGRAVSGAGVCPATDPGRAIPGQAQCLGVPAGPPLPRKRSWNSSLRLRRLPVAAGLVIAGLQLPWVPRQLHVEFVADRRMGDWIAANLPAGTRILSTDPVVPWYGRAVKVNLPAFKPSKLMPVDLAAFARQAKTPVILVDAHGVAWCPNVWAKLQAGQWQYGRILHQESYRKHTLYLLDLSGGKQAERPAKGPRAGAAGVVPRGGGKAQPSGLQVK